MATQSATQWHVKGTLLISCNCDYGCPCNFNARPTQGHCEGQWVWHVEEGSFGDVPLDRLTWSVTADWPAAIHEGGGRAICLYDERADDAQREAIEALVRGGNGGPWGIFINTYELEVFRPVPFELHLAGLDSSVKAGDSMELQLAPITNPVTGAEVHPGAVLPEGLVCKEASFGTSLKFKVSDAIEYDHSGKYTAIAPFEYSAS
jgi:Uncharacterized conserved protein